MVKDILKALDPEKYEQIQRLSSAIKGKPNSNQNCFGTRCSDNNSDGESNEGKPKVQEILAALDPEMYNQIVGIIDAIKGESNADSKEVSSNGVTPIDTRQGAVRPGTVRSVDTNSNQAGVGGSRPGGVRPGGTRPGSVRPAGTRPGGARPNGGIPGGVRTGTKCKRSTFGCLDTSVRTSVRTDGLIVDKLRKRPAVRPGGASSSGARPGGTSPGVAKPGDTLIPVRTDGLIVDELRKAPALRPGGARSGAKPTGTIPDSARPPTGN